ncbi:thioesterase family protein [Mycolicibacterium sp. S2-37]|uniref:thioesterase family protein n=1 Tax=Mycolicibacterium sp. S2-37 TaxID=2810297 RepID=UPI001A93B2C5|nr:thioesterase family protein [Mycolicibacterium sp. S2-37]MBO0680000.1 thioesterase family protein [Mycolicibacterium sp. S2-37]
MPTVRGPWGQSVSGNFVGGLLGHLAERAAPQDPQYHAARFTVDLMRPVAMAPISGRTRVVRQGRRLYLVDAELTQDRTVVSRASALFLRRGPQPPDDAWTASIAMPPVPADPPDIDDRPMLLWVFGGGRQTAPPAADLSGWQQPGPKSVWLRDVTPLVDDAVPTPFSRVAMAGDYASSLTSFGSSGLPFINADYTVSLSRLPDGPHIGLTALTHHSHDGIATGTAVMFDRLGPIGSATATALAHPGFAPRGISAASGR